MSVVTVGTMLVALAPAVEARERNPRPRREVAPRSALDREIRRAPRVEQRDPRVEQRERRIEQRERREQRIERRERRIEPREPRRQERAPQRAGSPSFDIPAPIVRPPPRPAPRVATPDPAPRVVHPSPPPVYAPSPVYASPGASVGVGVGSRGGVGVGGSVGTSGGGSVMDSVVNGAVLGGIGGPIGLAVGAGVGLLHGLWSKNRRDKQSQAETARQQEIDRQLEREVANQPHGEEQGVRVVKDHLADEPVRTASTTPDPMVASVPPAPAEPAKKKAPARDAVDQEGFRPVYEGDRVVRRERVGADGTPEVVLHYDKDGQIVRRQESTRADGRLDTTLFYANGKLERKESDTDGDGTTDVFAEYDGLGNLTQMDTVEGTTRTRTHYDVAGTVTREDQLGAKGELIASAFYEKGRVVRRELYEVDESAFNRVPLVSAQTPETK